jgi:hypothetical protein
MPQFNPTTEYDVISENIRIKDFYDYGDDYVVRPPYQRKSVWSRKKQQALLDSLFRRYYVPRIVIREVRLDEERVVQEVIDGQQRITTVQRFFDNELPLPSTLGNVHDALPGRYYEELSTKIRKFVDRKLSYQADIVKGIDDPENPDHQNIATEIFWRLQQGESLNYMEVAHARLSSLARNFVVKYADDQTFDFDTYRPIDNNSDKHPLFSIIRRKNDRMQHLALLTRFLILEQEDGPTDIRENHVKGFIDDHQVDNGIGSLKYEETDVARAVRSDMQAFYEVFKDDPMLDDATEELPILRVEYFIISLYLLLRHLRRHYVFDSDEQELFHEFAYEFHDRWRESSEDDMDVQIFANNRQQSGAEIEARHRIMRQAFFDYAAEHEHEMKTKDERRGFSEAERIRIYRRDQGLCQQCLEEGKPEKEARVSWSGYEADHVLPHSRGGQTTVDNGRVLCQYHNRSKGARV